MKFKFTSLLFFLFCLYSCHKSKETTCPVTTTRYVPAFYRQFNFKASSRWVYKNSSSGAVDTIVGWVCDGFQIYQPSPSTPHGCPGDKLESYVCELRHNMFPTSNGTFSYWYSNYATTTFMNVFQQNVGDSIKFSGNATQYIKLENYFTTLVINGTTFNNVYQMYYYPDLQGFKRLWWCPVIGIVKCEFVNSTTHLTEDWEVISYSAQVY